MGDVPTILGRDRRCRGCSYELEGLPASGRCPECGRWYPPFEGDEAGLSALDITRRLVWPIPLILLIMAAAHFADTSREELVKVPCGFIAVGLALVTLINAPLQILVLLRWNRGQGRGPGHLVSSLPLWGRVEVGLALIIAGLPWYLLVRVIMLWVS